MQAAERNWPIGPDDFDELIETKTFTNGADKEAVKALFRKMSVNQLGGIKTLDFDGEGVCPLDNPGAKCTKVNDIHVSNQHDGLGPYTR